MSYLEQFLQNQQYFPQSIQNHLQIIKQLDNKVYKNQITLDKKQEQYLKKLQTCNKNTNIKAFDNLKKEIEQLQKESIQLSQQKMNESEKVYQRVDDSIKDLEINLKKFEEEIKQHNQNFQYNIINGSRSLNSANNFLLNNNQQNGHKKIKNNKNPNLKSFNEYINSRQTNAQKKKKKAELKFLSKMNTDKKSDKLVQSAIEKEKEIMQEWEVDPNEPKYCYCNKASYGDMIKCDNSYCQMEWFHYECAGIKDQPISGSKWFCKTCKNDKKKK